MGGSPELIELIKLIERIKLIEETEENDRLKREFTAAHPLSKQHQAPPIQNIFRQYHCQHTASHSHSQYECRFRRQNRFRLALFKPVSSKDGFMRHIKHAEHAKVTFCVSVPRPAEDA
jgi:hypothetical protein